MKIISITNCHCFDGIEISPKAFNEITSALEYSRYVHTIEYIDDNGEKQTAVMK